MTEPTQGPSPALGEDPPVAEVAQVNLCLSIMALSQHIRGETGEGLETILGRLIAVHEALNEALPQEYRTELYLPDGLEPNFKR